jgi:hypothetical protein
MFYLMMLPVAKIMLHGWFMNEKSMWKIICLTDAFSTTDLMQTGLELSPTLCSKGQ